MQKTKRQGNFDVLKIIAIFFIVLHHYALWSGWKFEPGFHLNKLAAQTLLVGGKLGVNIFVLITGFFMIYSTPKLKSLVTVWIETTLISLLVYSVTILLSLENQVFDLQTFIRRLFPVVFGQYWFVTSYSILYLSIPLLNKILNRTEASAIKKGLKVSFIILSLYTFIYYNKGLNFSFPLWFGFLYSLGAYIRLDSIELSKIPIKKTTISVFTVLILGIILNGILQYLFTYPDLLITKILTFLGWTETIFYTRDASPLLLILAILIFITFMNISISPKKYLSYISRASFGVYILQSSPWFSTEYLWPIIVNAKKYSSSLSIVIYGIIVTLAIFIIGLLVYSVLFPISRFITNILARPILYFQKLIFG